MLGSPRILVLESHRILILESTRILVLESTRILVLESITMFYIIYCFWASYFFACLRGVARSLGTQYFVSLFACAGVARPLVNHIHHLYFHGFLSGFPISSSITNCIIIVIISGSSMSSGSGSGSSSSSSSSCCCCYCCCCC